MNRRKFIGAGLAAGGIYSLGGLPGVVSQASANFQTVDSRIVANLMLMGGPDWRHVFPPAFNNNTASYGHQFWKARYRSFGLKSSDNATLSSFWSNNFDQFNSNGHTFGISRACPWLRQRWEQGDLAIIANGYGSESRDHAHSIIVSNQGNRLSNPNDVGRSGWGGRLASRMNKNVVALTMTPSEFCNGLHSSGNINLIDTSNLISARDTRRLGLYEPDPNANEAWDTRANTTRALAAYYKAKRIEMPKNSPYRMFVEHEQKLREFGEQVNDLLRTVPEPGELRNLHDWKAGRAANLNNNEFGLQLRNLYDALACNKLLNMGVASLEYGGWDSHEAQADFLKPKLDDLFGANRGLDRLWQVLPGHALHNLVMVIGGEFGRQLVANGGSGTDHGRGTSYLVVGRQVRGGVYGDLFPEEELGRLNNVSPDIAGKTAFDHIFGSVCDWAQPGSSSAVFPNRNGSRREPGIQLESLFS